MVLRIELSPIARIESLDHRDLGSGTYSSGVETAYARKILGRIDESVGATKVGGKFVQQVIPGQAVFNRSDRQGLRHGG
jgi:hypothetical protein